uniref:Uncharacterized protein n=1 Tax=viral metagenome TaxID=1070528 RepID=A0A6C0HSQ7_9ZZZZ
MNSFNSCYALYVSKPVLSVDFGPTQISQESGTSTVNSVTLKFYPPTNYPHHLIIQI